MFSSTMVNAMFTKFNNTLVVTIDRNRNSDREVDSRYEILQAYALLGCLQY